MDKNQANEQSKKMGQIYAKAMSDASFHQKLSQDPVNTLREHGLDVPSDVSVKVHKSDANNLHLVLPKKPTPEVSDEHLATVAGGGTTSSASTAGTVSCPAGTAGTASTAGSAGN